MTLVQVSVMLTYAMIPHMPCDTLGYLISCIHKDDVIVERCDDCVLPKRVTFGICLL